MLMKDTSVNSKKKFIIIILFNYQMFTNNDRLFVVIVDIFEGDCGNESYKKK